MNEYLFPFRLFVRVAHTGSFSRASKELGISQSSASRIIAALERDLGVMLLVRTTRAMALTPAGASYLANIEPILAAFEEANFAACSGLMKPDTHLGENARQIEVSDDQTTPYLFP